MLIESESLEKCVHFCDDTNVLYSSTPQYSSGLPLVLKYNNILKNNKMKKKKKENRKLIHSFNNMWYRYTL